MSVLVEALTLVVRKLTLDISFPGGTDAFLQAARELERPPRFICRGDAHLVNLSFYDPEHLQPVVALLGDHGVVGVDDGSAMEMVYVDQHHGPTMPCEWLEWQRHHDGFTLAWMTGTEPGDMAAPEHWTPERSRRLVRRDIRDEPGRMMPLAAEDGLETWLDFETGQQLVGLPHRDEPASRPAVSAARAARRGELAPRPLFEMALQALQERGWRFDVLDDEPATRPAVRFQVRGPHTAYDCTIRTDEPSQQVLLYVTLPAGVPEPSRAAVCEAIAWANYALVLGNFEVHPRDGEVRFKVSTDVEGGTLGVRMVQTMISTALATFDRYYLAFMRVAYGDAVPQDAVMEAEVDALLAGDVPDVGADTE